MKNNKLVYSEYIIFEYYWIINMDNCSLKINVTVKLQRSNYKYLKNINVSHRYFLLSLFLINKLTLKTLIYFAHKYLWGI